MAYQEKIAGQPCNDCGAKLVKSPKTGKVFCEKKCWLTKPKGYPSQEAQEDHIVIPENKPNWDEISQKKADEIRENVLIKVAESFTIAQFEKGTIPADMMVDRFDKLLQELKARNF